MAGKALLRRIAPPKQLAGEVTVPGDKSISHRAIILNSLALGSSEISNLSPGRDCPVSYTHLTLPTNREV